MISYSITHNSHLMSFTAHLQGKQFAVIHYTVFNSNLAIQLVLITFIQFAHKMVLTMVLPSHGCHSNLQWVTLYVLKTYMLTEAM